MSTVAAFAPGLPSQPVVVTGAVTTLPWATLCPPSGPQYTQVRVFNEGTANIRFLQSAGNAVAVTLTNGIPMLSNSVEVFTLSAGVDIQFIASGTGSTATFTPGAGI